jgi:hypothetical protein
MVDPSYLPSCTRIQYTTPAGLTRTATTLKAFGITFISLGGECYALKHDKSAWFRCSPWAPYITLPVGVWSLADTPQPDDPDDSQR